MASSQQQQHHFLHHPAQKRRRSTIHSTSPPPPAKRAIRLEERGRQQQQNGVHRHLAAAMDKKKPKVAVTALMANGEIASKLENNGNHQRHHHRHEGLAIDGLLANGHGGHNGMDDDEAAALALAAVDDDVEKMAVPLPPVTMSSNNKTSQIYKLVLTGGPCGGKTTGQERLATFFEGLGWKVFTVPETASILLSGRVRFQELNKLQCYQFQKDLLLTLIQIEQVYFNQAKLINDRNVLIICDRGALDPSAYMDEDSWERLLHDTKLDIFDLRDNRYNQIVHMVSAADGASRYYTCANNTARKESMPEALEQDRRTREAWIGHQCLSIVDNSDCRNFNDKIMKLIKVVCERLGISYEDRLARNSKKRKWLVLGVNEAEFQANKFEEFAVIHHYLLNTGSNNQQIRLRSRCQNHRTTYTLTTRRFEDDNGTKLPEPVETRKQLTHREFNLMVSSICDPSRSAVHKKRRCFVSGNVYFQLDTYVHPLPPACNGNPLMILETYTTKPVGDKEPRWPHFLKVDREITGDPHYSMYNLADRTHNQQQNGSRISPS